MHLKLCWVCRAFLHLTSWKCVPIDCNHTSIVDFYVLSLLRLGIYTSGKGSSAVGLTASVMRDPETRDMVLESGSYVFYCMVWLVYGIVPHYDYACGSEDENRICVVLRYDVMCYRQHSGNWKPLLKENYLVHLCNFVSYLFLLYFATQARWCCRIMASAASMSLIRWLNLYYVCIIL